MSNFCVLLARKCSASIFKIWQFCAFNNVWFCLSALNARLAFSIIVTFLALRESASKPIAPVPVNKSRQVLPVSSCPSQLKTVCRTRSGVGLRPSTSGNLSTRLRQMPALILTWLILDFCKVLKYTIKPYFNAILLIVLRQPRWQNSQVQYGA